MKTILFVEDDPILGTVYVSQLKKAGYAVTLARDGEAGLNALQNTRPDLVLLDIMLPKVSGMELLRILRSTPSLTSVPVIVFTNAFQENVLAEAEKLSPNRILTKSRYIPRDVINIVREILNDRKEAEKTRATAEAISAEKAANVELQAQLPKKLEECRALVHSINRSAEERPRHLRTLSSQVRGLIGMANAAGLRTQSYFCEALETLLNELVEAPERAGLSNLRTVTQAVDFLYQEFKRQSPSDIPLNLQFNILTVDDDTLSRRAIGVALGRIDQSPMEVTQASEALALCQQRAFDLIFLDVDMPEMNGFELCQEIRKSKFNQGTPVVFVTGHTQLQNRAQSMLSGGTDFIGKPFQFMELSVKTLIHLLRSKLKQPTS